MCRTLCVLSCPGMLFCPQLDRNQTLGSSGMCVDTSFVYEATDGFDFFHVGVCVACVSMHALLVMFTTQPPVHLVVPTLGVFFFLQVLLLPR